MRTHPRSKIALVLATTFALLLLAAAPASATRASGEILWGSLLFEPNFGLDPVRIELTGEDVHICDEDDEPDIDIDFSGNTTSGTTTFDDLDNDVRHMDLGGGTYAVVFGLDPSGLQSGTYTHLSAAGPMYDVSTALGLVMHLYETTDCEITDLACFVHVPFGLGGTFTGTISPSASGGLLLDGNGEMDTSSCDVALSLAFTGAKLWVDGWYIDF